MELAENRLHYTLAAGERKNTKAKKTTRILKKILSYTTCRHLQGKLFDVFTRVRLFPFEAY